MSAYEQGRAAWFEGRDITENPYPKDTHTHQDWNTGWDSIRLESEYAGWEE